MGRSIGVTVSSVSRPPVGSRQPIRPPSGYEGFLSRRQAAGVLGFASEFNVRRLEKEGRLRPVRGVMGSAWYPRAQVLALKEDLAAPPVAVPGPGAASRPRTPVDLVADTGISIARAERVYRFWLAHDAHPLADEVRGGAVATRSRTAPPPERRSEARMERDSLLQQMRSADPTVRAAAFEKLRASR
jgi:hypothetical protein